MYLQKIRPTERGRKTESVEAGKVKGHLQFLHFSLGNLGHSARKWFRPHHLSHVVVLLCLKSFLCVSRSTGLPSLFKECSSWAECDLEKRGASCPAGSDSNVAGQPLLFLTAPGWRRSSNMVCSLLSCIACGVTVKPHLFCVFSTVKRKVSVPLGLVL